MADVIKRIKTSSGIKQIDYQSLANKNHNSDHGVNGTDPITPEMIGALSADNAELTGTPTAPTAVEGTNTDQIATTAFVQTALGRIGALKESDFTFSTTDPGAGSVATTKFYVVYEE